MLPRWTHHPLPAGLTKSAALAAVAVAAAAAFAAPAADAAPNTTSAGYVQTNLVADQPGHAATTDPYLVNPWGLSRGPNSPVWVSDNGTGLSTLYAGAVGGQPVTTVPLIVSIPGGAPTGQVFNDTSSFGVPHTGAAALFIFAGENGDITAWNQSSGTSAALVAHTAGAVYKGITISHSPFGPLLLAANFHTGRIDVFDRSFHRLSVDGLFRDPNIPAGYAPFNVAAIGDRILVSYAQQDAARHDDTPGLGHGFVDAFSTYGTMIHRLVSRGDLNSPWALTLAPANFGRFSGDLLVGNFGNGRIHAYDPVSGFARGTLRTASGTPIAIDGLWGLLSGDSVAGGPNSLWFSAGPDGESHGLIGLITAG